MVLTILFWYTSIRRNNGFSLSRFKNLIKEFKIPYSHLNDESKARIASHEEKLDTILWYYEDLECPDVGEIISERLRNGEQITLPYGKLMDRLLLIRTLRDNKPDIPTFYRNYEHERVRGFAHVNNQLSIINIQINRKNLHSIQI